MNRFIKKNLENNLRWWWIRSAFFGNSEYAGYVYTDGDSVYRGIVDYYDIDSPICPIFEI